MSDTNLDMELVCFMCKEAFKILNTFACGHQTCQSCLDLLDETFHPSNYCPDCEGKARISISQQQPVTNRNGRRKKTSKQFLFLIRVMIVVSHKGQV